MHILLNVESLKPPLTGIGRYTLELLRGLQLSSSIRRLTCFANYRLLEADCIEAALVPHASGSQRSAVQAVRAMVRSLPGAYPLRASIRGGLFRLRTRSLQGALYHEPNYILKPFDGPCVATVHDLSHIHYPEFHPGERVAHLNKRLPATLSKAQQIITVSRFVKDEIVASFGIEADRINVVPLGVRSDFRPRAPEETQPVLEKYGLRHGGYLLVVATHEPRKNLASLLDAYALLGRELKEAFPLALVGAKGWGRPGVEERLAAMEHRDEIARIGYVSENDLPSLYAGAAGFAFPSVYEGFGLPPLEAAACGVPVLTSETSAMPEVLSRSALRVDPFRVEAIHHGLEALLTDSRFRAEAARDGPIEASGYTWQECVRSTLEVYRQALGYPVSD